MRTTAKEKDSDLNLKEGKIGTGDWAFLEAACRRKGHL